MPMRPREIAKFAFGLAKDVVQTVADRFLGGEAPSSSYSPPPPPPRRAPTAADRKVEEATRQTEKVAEDVERAAEKAEKAEKTAPQYEAKKAAATKKDEAKKKTAAKKAAPKAKKPAKPKAKAAPKAKAKKPAKAAAKSKAEPKAKAAPKKRSTAKKAKPKKLSAAELLALPEAERWPAYKAGLPANSQKFLALLEEKGTLEIDEAVSALDLKGPKAVGGLTGAMSRWAPQAGVTLPFEAKKHEDGTRYWEWTGA